MEMPFFSSKAIELEALQGQSLDARLEAVCRDFAHLAARFYRVPIAFVTLVKPNQSWFRFGIGLEKLQLPDRTLLETIALSEPKGLIVSDTAVNSIAAEPWLTDAGVRFYAGVPLIDAYGQAIGALNLMDTQPRIFQAEQSETLLLLGQQLLNQVLLQVEITALLNTAIEHQQAEENLQQQTQQERLIAEITRHIHQSLDLEEILSTVVSGVRQFLQTDRVFIYRFEPDWSGIIVVESVGVEWEPVLGRKIKDTFFGESERRALYEQGRIQAIEDVHTSGLSSCHVDLLVRLQIRANLVVPIVQETKLWGLLVANHCSAPRQWQWLEINLLRQLAAQVAIAIQQSQLYKQTRQQAQRQQSLNRVIQAIRNSLDLTTIFATAVHEIAALLQADRAEIMQYLPEQKVWRNVADYCQDPELPSALGLEIADTNNPITHQLKQLCVIQLSDTSNLDPSANRELTKLYPGSWLMVPLFFRANPANAEPPTIWGSVSVVKNLPSVDWQASDVELLRAVADQLAIAIQQSELYQQVQIELHERKRAEQKIREQAALLDVATDAIFVRNLDQQILFWNKGAERLYGWTAEEAIGKNAAALLFREPFTQLKDIEAVLTERGEWQGELRKFTKFGKEVIVESRWTLVRDEAGRPKSILAVDVDVTEKKQLELQFFRTQRIESLGTLAGGIAHDLNNVLTPILAIAQLLQIKISNLDDRSQQLLKTLETNTKRAAALVKQVLSFARGMEGKHIVLQPSHLITEVRQIAKETFPKSIEIQASIDRSLAAVRGDITQLHQVLMNLCVNARDAMPNGGILEIAAENRLIDEHYARMNLDARVGAYVVLSVTDTGTGMPPEILDRIFEPFFTTKAVGQGTGLGLSTVSGIVKSHGGFVTVNSQIGKGTQFRVYLPAVEMSETITVEDSALPRGNHEWVLVVDDEAAIRDITKTSLEAFSYQVLTANDGIEAIALYAQHRDKIDVVLVDMMMPSMDGPITIRTLQKMNPSVKIIAVSGLITFDQATTVALDTGVQAFLSKPYTSRELLQTLHRILTASEATDSP
jgi:two-component system, cell cycle sensor histidine kinase and response regulator CckA